MSRSVEVEYTSDHNYYIVLLMACVKKATHGACFTSRYQWDARHRLKSDACHVPNKKQEKRLGNVVVSYGEGQYDKNDQWNLTLTCPGSIAYRRGT